MNIVFTFGWDRCMWRIIQIFGRYSENFLNGLKSLLTFSCVQWKQLTARKYRLLNITNTHDRKFRPSHYLKCHVLNSIWLNAIILLEKCENCEASAARKKG